jgi:hypothetical protein
MFDKNAFFSALGNVSSFLTATNINAFGAVAVAVFTWLLWDSTRKLWKASERQLSLTKLSLHATQAAVVFIRNFESTHLPSTPDPVTALRVTIVMENAGPTAAINLKSHINFTAPSAELDDTSFDYADIEGPGGTSTVLGPKQVSELSAFDFPIELLLKLRSRERHGYLYGWIEYDDVFDDTARHRTEFCFKLDVYSDPRVRQSCVNFNPWGKHNAIDRGCLRGSGEEIPSRPRGASSGQIALR